jgi:hypothetical protein
MPKPNAFDYYVAAGKLLKDVPKIKDASLPAKTASTAGLLTASRRYTLAEKEALVGENAAALAKLREGFAYNYQSPPVRSMDTMLPHLSTFRTMGMLIGLEGEIREAHGDMDGALRSYLDAVRFGEYIQHGKYELEVLLGNSMGKRPIWAAVEKLDSRQALGIARELQEMSSHRVDFAAVVQERKWSTEASVLEMLNKPNWRRELGHMYTEGEPWHVALLINITHTRRSMFNSLSAHESRCVARARLPYASTSPMPSAPDDPLCDVFGIYLDMMWVGFLNRGEVRDSLLTISLALRAYKLDHSSYPASLADLTPHYLKNIPNDPFALKGTYGYRLNGSKYVLYSVGPDKKDDGGTPISDPAAPTPGSRYVVSEDSKGDIVAGINAK